MRREFRSKYKKILLFLQEKGVFRAFFHTGHANNMFLSRQTVFYRMSAKSRGSQGERDLVQRFWSAGWAAFRAAGSGSVRYPVPDVIAGNAARKLAIEAKITTAIAKYFTKEEIDDLQSFCTRFGCEAWVAVRFFRKPWRFVSLEDLRKTEASHVLSARDAERKGLTFEELVK
jgi:Holliday junction resolvase